MTTTNQLLICSLLVIANGCTTIRTVQRDESPERAITTEVRASAWFSSSQAIARMKALQTDKTQSIGGEGIQQQGATNAVQALGHLARILEAIRPIP